MERKLPGAYIPPGEGKNRLVRFVENDMSVVATAAAGLLVSSSVIVTRLSLMSLAELIGASMFSAVCVGIIIGIDSSKTTENK